jgi:hypothetical protein
MLVLRIARVPQRRLVWCFVGLLLFAASADAQPASREDVVGRMQPYRGEIESTDQPPQRR